MAAKRNNEVVLCLEPLSEIKRNDKNMRGFCCFSKKLEKNTLLVSLTMSGVFLGVVFGLGLRQANLSNDAKTLVAFPGEIFLRLLKMLVIPLITTSVITGVVDLHGQKSGRIGLQIVVYYLSTTFCAVCIGLALVLAIQPGVTNSTSHRENSVKTSASSKFSAMDTVLDLIRNLFPKNLVEAWFRVVSTNKQNFDQKIQHRIFLGLDKGNRGQTTFKQFFQFLIKFHHKNDQNVFKGLITFCLMLGIALGKQKKSGKREKGAILYLLFNELFSVFMDIMMNIMWFAPIGICSLIAGNLLQVGDMLFTMRTLGLYMTTVIVGFFIQSMLVYSAIYWIATRKNPLRLYTSSLQAILTMIGTTSSSATLPATMRCAEENLKIDKRFTRLVLPLGATINMDGTALFQSVVAVTVAQLNGISLSVGQILTVCITGSLASVGAAAIPGSGIVVVLFVLQSVGLPVEAIGLLYTVDWFLERFRGIVNILGDVTGVCVISHLNRDIADVNNELLGALGEDDDRESGL